MNSFNFKVPGKIIFGKGSLGQLAEVVKNMGLKKVLIISGPNLKARGLVDRVKNFIYEAECDVAEFTETEANPSIDTVRKAVEAFKEFEADGIIAFGGGSPMDVAKTVGVLAKYGGNVRDYEGSGKVPGKIVPMIAIPTTAGTGSEVTAASVITDREENYKAAIVSPYLIPDTAVLDPELLATMPASVAAATGVDAFVHALEAYVSKAASPMSDAVGEKAMELIGANIRRFVANHSDIEAAGAMLVGSTLAGIAFTWGRLGNVHAMSHPVSGFFNVPHGVANAILLPWIVEYNASEDKGKYEKIYVRIAKEPVADFKPEMLAVELRKLNEELGIPVKLSEVGVQEGMISAMATDAMKSGNIAMNPRTTTQEDVESLYRKAL